MEKTTEELLNVLKSKKTYEDFFDQEVEELIFSSISEYLELLIKEKNLKKSDVIKKSNLDINYGYQLFNGNKTNPSRDKVIMLSFGMGLNLLETRKLLKVCNLSELYPRIPRDSIIIFCIEKKKDLIECNQQLSEYGMDILE